MLFAALLAMPLLVSDPVAASPFEEVAGCSLTAELSVAAVQKGSPADSAGFEVGDALVHVDGKPVAGMDAQKLSEWLKEKGGAVHHVLVRKDGKAKLRTLRLKHAL